MATGKSIALCKEWSNMKAVYKNYFESDQKLKNAFLSIVAEKGDIKSISVSEVVEKAKLNRGTFYNHYADLDGLLQSMEDSLMAEISKKWNECVANGHLDDGSFVDALTIGMRKNEDLYRKIVPSIPRYVFVDLKKKFVSIMSDVVAKKGDNKDVSPIALRIVANGVVSLYLDYFLGEDDFSLEEIAKEAKAFFQKCFA